MKKIILLLFVLFSIQFSFANLNDAVLKQARDYYKNGNYEKALELYKNYSKEADLSDMKDIYLEMRNNFV